MALTDKLTNIADAIRDKTGGTDPLTLDQMAVAIAGIETGGGGSVYSGSLTPAENVLNMEIDIGAQFSHFVVCTTKEVTGYGVKSTGFAFADFNTQVFCGGASNNGGTAMTVSLIRFLLENDSFVINLTSMTKTENTIAIKTSTSGSNLGYFIGGVTYQWYAW